jgi:hypothetical protein
MSYNASKTARSGTLFEEKGSPVRTSKNLLLYDKKFLTHFLQKVGRRRQKRAGIGFHEQKH